MIVKNLNKKIDQQPILTTVEFELAEHEMLGLSVETVLERPPYYA
ncbi:hypothetical protein [Enterococcus avium]|nr:hypothetical protein [Enterococcus avium]